MDILVVGAGVIGTVYGAQLSAAGHSVDIYEHGPRTEHIKKTGLLVLDVATGVRLRQSVRVVGPSLTVSYEFVLVSVRQDQIASLSSVIAQIVGAPTVLLFGNYPNGLSALPDERSRAVELGFPGVGGSLVADTVEYLRIAEQPTAIQAIASGATLEFATAMQSRGFKVNRVVDMRGWLLYHAVFVASITAALYRHDCDPGRLGRDRHTVMLMCQAIQEGFAALRSRGHRGEPRNLRTLHLPWLRPFAIWYWARVFRSSKGELMFAAHARHARDEMQGLAKAALAATANSSDRRNHLVELLTN